MNTDMNIGGIVAKTLNRLLPTLLPNNGRRAVFLTTLVMEISKISPEHKELFREFNEKFKLSSRDVVLDFPIQLHDVVWEGRGQYIRRLSRTDEISDEEITGMANRMIKECAEWSRYDDYAKVLEETKEVIKAGIDYENRITC